MKIAPGIRDAMRIFHSRIPKTRDQRLTEILIVGKELWDISRGRYLYRDKEE